jgi:hypothetical protein
MALLHEVVTPCLRRPRRASFHREDAAVRRCGDREQSGERAAFGGLQPARLRFCRIDRGKPAPGDADQEAPVGMQRKTAGIAFELGDQRARCKVDARQFQNALACRNKQRAVAVGHDVVETGQGIADRRAAIETVVGAEGAVQRRDGVLLAIAIDDVADVPQEMVEHSHGRPTRLVGFLRPNRRHTRSSSRRRDRA